MKSDEANMKRGVLAAADLIIDFDAGTIEKDGRILVLPDLTWRTLCCLAGRRGAIVSIEELIQSVWGDREITNETVTQRIKLLRRELGDDGQNPRYIGTVRNRGFRFLPETTSPKAPQFSNNFSFSGKLTVAALLVAAFATAGLYYQFSNSPAPKQTETELARIIARGNEYLSRLQHDDNQLAISLFEQALERDNDNQRALIGLSFAASHNSSKFNYPLEWAVRSETLARKAITLGQSAQAYHALAFALDAQGRTDDAIIYYEKGRSLVPDNAAITGSTAYLYQVRGQLARALEYGLTAHTLNPDIAFSEVQVAATLHLLERDTEASEWIARGLTLKPDNVFIYSAKANIQFALGNDDELIETIHQATANGVERPELYVMQGLVAARAGRLDDARSSFLMANDISPSRKTGKPYRIWVDVMSGADNAQTEAQLWVSHIKSTDSPATLLVAAGLHTSLDEQDLAIETLSSAVDAGYRDWRTLSGHPMFSNLHNSPSFATVLDRIRSLVQDENSKVEQAHLVDRR